MMKSILSLLVALLALVQIQAFTGQPLQVRIVVGMRNRELVGVKIALSYMGGGEC